MPDGERGSTTFMGPRTAALRVVVFVFAVCLAWWFWGETAGADEVGDTTGTPAGAVDEPPSATGLAAGEVLPSAAPPPDAEPAPPPIPDSPVAAPDPEPVTAPVPVPEQPPVAELPRSERSVTDDVVDEQIDEPSAHETRSDESGSDEDEWQDSDESTWGDDEGEWIDRGPVDPEPVDPELGDPELGDPVWPPPEAPDGGWREEPDDPEAPEPEPEDDGNGAGQSESDLPTFLPKGSSRLEAKARDLDIARRNQALLARQVHRTNPALPGGRPDTSIGSDPGRPSPGPSIEGTGNSQRGGRWPRLPYLPSRTQLPVAPPALPPSAPGPQGSAGGSGAMGSGHGQAETSQLLERARLWASAVRGPGAAGGTLHQRSPALVEVAPAGVPGGRPPFTPD